jgi:hypothetical protein
MKTIISFHEAKGIKGKAWTIWLSFFKKNTERLYDEKTHGVGGNRAGTGPPGPFGPFLGMGPGGGHAALKNPGRNETALVQSGKNEQPSGGMEAG